jgi:3-oxoacid CoA-transferase
MLITELAVFKFIDSQLTLIEILPGSSLEEVRLKTEAKFIEKLK